RLPTFSVRLDPPLASDPARADKLAAESARRFGRDRRAVESDLRAAVERIEQSRQALFKGGNGVARGTASEADESASKGKKGKSDKQKERSDHREPKEGRDQPHQATLPLSPSAETVAEPPPSA